MRIIYIDLTTKIFSKREFGNDDNLFINQIRIKIENNSDLEYLRYQLSTVMNEINDAGKIVVLQDKNNKLNPNCLDIIDKQISSSKNKPAIKILTI